MAARDRFIGGQIANAEFVHRPTDQNKDTRSENDLPEQGVFALARGAKHFFLLQMTGFHMMQGVTALPTAIRHQDRPVHQNTDNCIDRPAR